MSDGILYEPRSLWSIGFANFEVGDPATVVRLNRQHFYNGTKWPMRLERLALSPVNYIVRRSYAIAGPVIFSSAIINNVQVAISAPFRQRYAAGSQRFTIANVAPQPRYMPPARPVAVPGGTNLQPSSLYGVTQLNFDRDLEVPEDGQVLFEMAAAPPSGIAANPINLSETQAFVGIQEATAVRGSGWKFCSTQTTVGYPTNYQQIDASYPYPYDPGGAAFGVPVQVPGAGEGGGAAIDTATWASVKIPSQQFADQKPTPSKSGPSKLAAMAIMINQIATDDAIHAIAQYSESPIEPVSSRIPVRMKSLTGTGEEWWRPGAPMSLVFDSITPALVYRLPRAITLDPGDTLDVQLRFPNLLDPNGEYENPIPVQLGVSLNGFAMIEV